jgi:hypothetical protein
MPKALISAAHDQGLAMRGMVHDDNHTVLLFGPDEPDFWGKFTTAPEYADGDPDPLDRWSKRILGALAENHGGRAVFPSDGPPYPPFLSWALASGQAWSSPIGPLVHAQAGLFISYRGAIILPSVLPLPDASKAPCPTCAAPCATACPVGALSPDHFYDVPRCKSHMRSSQGANCLLEGCLARRACPAAVDFQRLPAQSAFHQRAFVED